jgi:F-type H+-transporting ATPase subunit delta
MSEFKGVARPYAKAMFELALQRNSLNDWSNELNQLAFIAENKPMQSAVNNPLISRQALADIFLDIASDLQNGPSVQGDKKQTSARGISQEVVNLVNILAQKKRLRLLTDIARLYEKFIAECNKTVQVKVVSAYPIDKTRLQRLTDALEDNLKRQVTLDCSVDNTLLGGAIIYAGDRVIDGSLSSKLKRLAERLCS